MHEFKPVKSLYFSSIMAQVSARKAFRGKKLFFDLDGTLIKSEVIRAERPGEKTVSDYDKPHVSIEYRNKRFGFQVTRINRSAKKALRFARENGASIYITSAADDEYVRKVVRTTGLDELITDCFGYESMRHLIGKRWAVSPKDFSFLVESLGEADPIRNCIVLGNDPRSDVPYEPKGVVSIIGNMEKIIPLGFLHIELLAFFGKGHFGNGFDRVFEIRKKPASVFYMVRTDDWQFDKRTRGFARIIFVSPEIYEDMQDK